MKLLSHYADYTDALALGDAESVELGDSLGVGLTLALLDPDGLMLGEDDLLTLGEVETDDEIDADGVPLTEPEGLELFELDFDADKLELFELDFDADKLALGEVEDDTEAV
jgi:hypothetical protein